MWTSVELVPSISFCYYNFLGLLCEVVTNRLLALFLGFYFRLDNHSKCREVKNWQFFLTSVQIILLWNLTSKGCYRKIAQKCSWFWNFTSTRESHKLFFFFQTKILEGKGKDEWCKIDYTLNWGGAKLITPEIWVNET